MKDLFFWVKEEGILIIINIFAHFSFQGPATIIEGGTADDDVSDTTYLVGLL